MPLPHSVPRRVLSLLTGTAVAITVGLTASAGTAAPQTASSVRTALSLTAPSSGVYGSTIVLRGRLWRYGTSTGIGGATIRLQRSPHGRNSWSTLRTGRTVATGNYAFSVVQSSAYDYRTYYAGSATYGRAYSPVRYPVTTQKIVLDQLLTWDNVTGELRATGRVWPAPPTGTAVAFQRWDSGARVWVTIGTGRTSGNAITAWATRPGSVASYRFVIGARYPYGAGVSATRSFAHYVWRGAFVKPIRQVATGQGGSFYIWPRAQDSEQRTVEVRSVANTYVVAELDPTGCANVQAYNGNFADPGGTTTIRFYGGEIDTAVSYGPNEDANLGADISHAAQLFYQASHQGGSGGLRVRARLRMLCAN